MTPRKRWPNEAENARVDSIAAARSGLQAARKVAQGKTDALQGLTEVVDRFHQIVELLLTVGPKETFSGQRSA